MLETTAAHHLNLKSRKALVLGLICFALSFTLSTWMYPFMPDFAQNCDGIVNPKLLISSTAHLSEVNALRDRYLDLMIITLTGYVYDSRTVSPGIGGIEDLQKGTMNKEMRIKGMDWPEIGFTMIGNDALKSIKWMIETVIDKNIPGDFIETGVWKGGASIFAKAVLRVHGADKIRKVWVCDSFKGLPKARTQNDDDTWEKMKSLRVSKETVKDNFRRFDLLDENVKFVEGYFVDSLPTIRDELTELSILRLDGDMYESTMDILFNLYEKIAIGGFVIVDDYVIVVCKKAITEFRNMHNITEEIKPIWKDSERVYWVKNDHKQVKHEWYSKFLTSR